MDLYNNVVFHTVELVDFKNPNKRERKKASLLTDGSLGDRLANALASNPETVEETPFPPPQASQLCERTHTRDRRILNVFRH